LFSTTFSGGDQKIVAERFCGSCFGELALFNNEVWLVS
jgi:hypothetical protein